MYMKRLIQKNELAFFFIIEYSFIRRRNLSFLFGLHQ